MDELLQNALDRRDRLRSELTAIENFIRSYGPLKEQPTARQDDLFSPAPKKGTSRAASKKRVSAAIDAAEDIILKAGRPLSRSVLLKELEDLGHHIEGGDKSKVLGTNLWRSKRFYNLTGAGYWPRSTPIPAGYDARSRRPSMLLESDE